jgi:predicted O-linked N-acetylglucosamine transferase (SPINDLY family)
MGIPVLALKGNSFLSGTATSLANNAGLNDWVASDVDDYVNKAVQFASDLYKLAELRSSLRDRVFKSPLFDTPRFAKNFGDAMWGMWNQYCLSPHT